jgi:O-antigen/teichoic acid export membrane protein
VTAVRPRPSTAVLASATGQVSARAVHLVLNVVTSLLVVRHLGAESYGRYVLVVTVATVAGLVSDLGIARVAVREIARRPAAEAEVVGAVVAARLGLGVVATGLTLAASAALGARGELLAAAAVVSGLYFTEAVLSVVIVFHVRLEQQYEALVRVVAEALEAALVVALVTRGAGLVALVAAPVPAAACGAALAVVLARRRLGRPPRPATGWIVPLVREAWPSGLALLLAAAYLRLPGLLLVPLRSAGEAGAFGAAYQPVEYLLLASGVAINVALPLLAVARDTDRARFVALYRRGTEALIVATVPVGAVLVVAGPAVASAVLGPGFAASAAPLRVLGVALVPMVVSFWQSVVLLSAGQQRLTLAYDLVALAVTAGLGLSLVPAAGAVGAAVVILVTSLVVVACATGATTRRLGASLDTARVGAIVATGAGAGAGAQVLAAAGVAPGAGLAATLAAWALALWGLGLLPSPAVLDDVVVPAVGSRRS